MKLDATSVLILKAITSMGKVSVSNIAKEVGLGKGSVYSRLEKINYWLKLHGLNNLCDSDPGKIYVRGVDVEKIISLMLDIDKEYLLQPKERIDNILIFIMSCCNKVDVCHLSEANGVSRNTTLNDIKKITLESYKVQVKYDRNLGYQILGHEGDIRNLAFYIVQRNLHSKIKFIQNTLKINLFNAIDLNRIYIGQVISTIVNDIEYYTHLRFTDKDRKLLICLIYVFISRIIKSRFISLSEKQVEFVRRQKEVNIISDIVLRLSYALKIDISDEERLFVALLVIVLKGEREFDQTSSYDRRLIDCVREMVFSFEKLSGLYFKDRKQLSSQLFAHLRPAVARGIFGIQITNVLKEEVYKNYTLIMDTVRVVSKKLEDVFEITLDEDELCYISMNFASYVFKEDVTGISEKRVLLVTEGGKSSTRLLESQLLNLSIFPMTIDLMSASDINDKTQVEKYAFIITTSQILSLRTDLDVVQVNHILTSQQQIKIKMLLESRDYSWLIGGFSEKVARALAGRKLSENAIKIKVDELLENELKRGMLTSQSNEFSSLELAEKCAIAQHCSDWSQAIDLSGKQLLLSGHIDLRYLESIKNSIGQYGQYMYLADDIFLLHASPRYNLRQTADLSLLKVNKFAEIGEKPALIFLLVTSENGQQIRILEKLNTLLTNDAEVQRVKESKTLSDMQRILVNIE